MKHDPLYEEPELWVLKNVGSFSFEFMGGGRGVVCGVDCEEFSSVLGLRACASWSAASFTCAEKFPITPKIFSAWNLTRTI